MSDARKKKKRRQRLKSIEEAIAEDWQGVADACQEALIRTLDVYVRAYYGLPQKNRAQECRNPDANADEVTP